MARPRHWAQSDQCGVERDIKQGLLDEPTFKRMNNAYELVGEERYDEAYAIMAQLRERANDPYVQAVLAQGIAQVEWARENYDQALKEFELAVELDALPNRTHYALMYQIAQLYYMQERFDDALERLELWFCKIPTDQVTASAYVLQGIHLYPQGRLAGSARCHQTGPSRWSLTRRRTGTS